jgi:hypothetical protein
MDDPIDVATKPSEAFSRRVQHFRRVLAKGVGRSPPSLLKLVLDRAAALCAEEERAMRNPKVSIEIKVRLAGAARRARHDVAIMVGNKAEPEPTLSELMEGA